MLSDEEEAEMMQFLEPNPGERISIAKLHGLFTAIAAGPEKASIADRLPITLKAGGLSAIRNWFEDLRREKAIAVIIATADPEMWRAIKVANTEEGAAVTIGLIGDLVPLISRYWQFEAELDDFVEPQQAVAETQVPRNAPCPCGSGKKYKHCCGSPTRR